MSKSVADVHRGIVQLLKDRGEPVINLAKRTMLKEGDTPDVCAKGAAYPSEHFHCGTAAWSKGGKITIWEDMLTSYTTGYTLDDLGLCDPAMWYENGDLVHKTKHPEPIVKRCECCGQVVK